MERLLVYAEDPSLATLRCYRIEAMGRWCVMAILFALFLDSAGSTRCTLRFLRVTFPYQYPCGFLAPSRLPLPKWRSLRWLTSLPRAEQPSASRSWTAASVTAVPMDPSPAYRCRYTSWGPVVYTNTPSHLSFCEHVIDPFPLRNVPCMICACLSRAFGVVAQPSAFDCIMNGQPAACVAIA